MKTETSEQQCRPACMSDFFPPRPTTMDDFYPGGYMFAPDSSVKRKDPIEAAMLDMPAEIAPWVSNVLGRLQAGCEARVEVLKLARFASMFLRFSQEPGLQLTLEKVEGEAAA